MRSLEFTLVTTRINDYGLTVHLQYIPKYLAYTIYQYHSIVLMILLIRLLGVCGVQGIVGLGSHGMRTRCHLLTFKFYLLSMLDFLLLYHGPSSLTE